MNQKIGLPSGVNIVKEKVGFSIDIEKITYRFSKNSTFFPKSWDIKKIEQKIKEALDNVVRINGNKYIGKTKEGIYIEMYVNKETKEINTAYIIKELK